MRSSAQAVPCQPASPASILSSLNFSRCAVALFIAPENSGSFRHSVIVSGLIPARRAASSSVSPLATASAILATTSGVRFVGRPSSTRPRLLFLPSKLTRHFRVKFGNQLGFYCSLLIRVQHELRKSVTAAIIRRNGFSFARRSSGEKLVGFWEFPGGKVENGETPEESLARVSLKSSPLWVKTRKCQNCPVREASAALGRWNTIFKA